LRFQALQKKKHSNKTPAAAPKTTKTTTIIIIINKTEEGTSKQMQTETSLMTSIWNSNLTSVPLHTGHCTQ